MTKIRLEYVHEFVDRHGKARRYFRKPGFKQVPLPGAPGSDEFMTVYQLALAGQSPRVQVGAGRTRPGSVNAAVVGYYNSLPFRSLAIGTQKRPKLFASAESAKTAAARSSAAQIETLFNI